MALRNILASEYDVARFMDDFAVLYLQDIANFSITDEGSGQGPPARINHIVEIDPAQPTYGEAVSANGWRYGGDSSGGLAINITRETRMMESDQHPRAAEKHQQWVIAVTGNLVQFEVEAGSLDNLLAVLGGGTMVDIGSTPPQKRVTVPLGSDVEYRRAALVYPHEFNNEERTICFVVRKCLVKATGAVSFQGRTQASIPFSMDAMEDSRPTVPTGEELMYLLYAPGT